jgi:hypothetical protein
MKKLLATTYEWLALKTACPETFIQESMPLEMVQELAVT